MICCNRCKINLVKPDGYEQFTLEHFARWFTSWIIYNGSWQCNKCKKELIKS